MCCSIRNCLLFALDFQCRASKTLGISQVIDISLLLMSPWVTPNAMLMRTRMVSPERASGWGLVTRKTKFVIRGLKLWASLTSRERRQLKMELSHVSCHQWFDQLCLWKETPVKTLSTEAWWSCWLVNTLMCPAWVMYPNFLGRGHKALHSELSQTSPYMSLHLAVRELYHLSL